MIRTLPKRERRGYTRAGRHKRPAPGQLTFAFPSAVIVQFTPGANNSGNPFVRALQLKDAGKTEAAVYAYLDAVERGQNVADALCNLGVIASNAGQTEQALAYFSRALQREPAHATSHHNLGNLFDDIGLGRAAKVHYEVAVALRPSGKSYYNLALVLESLGDADHAIAVLEQCLGMGLDQDGDIL